MALDHLQGLSTETRGNECVGRDEIEGCCRGDASRAAAKQGGQLLCLPSSRSMKDTRHLKLIGEHYQIPESYSWTLPAFLRGASLAPNTFLLRPSMPEAGLLPILSENSI